jgi:hypothetical protein
MKTQGYIKLISSADTSKNSVLQLNISPGEKNPWHYHTLFSERLRKSVFIMPQIESASACESVIKNSDYLED